MWEILKQLFSPSQYIPHGHCYLWQSQLVWLHIISDLLIAIAYYSIPAMLIYFIYKRNDVPFLGIFGLFGAFIILCGTGHLMEIWTLWHPAYWVSENNCFRCCRTATPESKNCTAPCLRGIGNSGQRGYRWTAPTQRSTKGKPRLFRSGAQRRD